MKRCLYCYLELEESNHSYHEKCSKKIFGRAQEPKLGYKLSDINDLAKQVLNKRLAVPGVQPKLSLTFSTQSSTDSRLTIVGLWNGIYILKPPTEDFPLLPENEDLTMKMAAICGIPTAVHSLIRFQSGELAYIAKRFDRVIKRRKMEKLHVEDMCQLTGQLTENKYNSSMERVAKVTYDLTTNKGLEMLTLFQITVFSFLTGNADMHLKNFSLLKDESGTVSLAPAYDLLATKLAVPGDLEEMALTLNGKKNKLSMQDFKVFANHCGINDRAMENVFAGFSARLLEMKAMIERSFLTKELKGQYFDLLDERFQRLNI